jgi:hypothetical protein
MTTLKARGGTISAFNGIEPIIETFADPDREAVAVGEWLADCIAEGMPPDESGAPCATNGELKRARSAVKVVIAAAAELTDKIENDRGPHPDRRDAPSQTFGIPAVAVMACDDEAIRQRRSRLPRRYSLWAVPRTRADVVERALAQSTDLQLATLEPLAGARLAAQDAQEQGGQASAPGIRRLHPVATTTAVNRPRPPTPSAREPGEGLSPAQR